MFRMSKMADYALLLLHTMGRRYLELSSQESDPGANDLWSAQSLVDETQLPMPTVRKCLKLLVDADLVISFRGASGGYKLPLPPKQITLAEIITAIEGPLALAECTRPDGGHCELDQSCDLKVSLKSISQIVMNYLETISLSDLINARAVSDLTPQSLTVRD